MYLQLMRDTTGYDLRLYSGKKNVFTSKSSKTVFYNDFNNLSFIQLWQFVPDNGTLIINPSALLLDACTGQLVGHYFTSE